MDSVSVTCLVNIDLRVPVSCNASYNFLEELSCMVQKARETSLITGQQRAIVVSVTEGKEP